MSKPMTAEQWRTALRAEGVRFSEYEAWTTHNRNSAGPFADVHGVMIHHTAGTNSLSLCRNGRPDLPGPLAHAHLAKNGLVTMLSTGRANHAGKGSQAVYSSVLNEVTAPRPGADEVDGNAHFYGIEIENLGNGTDPYPKEQLDSAVRWTAAICRQHGWSEKSVIGHKEWTTRKKDPTFGMDAFRRLVGYQLAKSEETPVTEKVPGLNVEPVRPQAYRDVLETDAVPAPRNHPDAATHKYWTTESYLRFIAEKLISIENELKK